MTTTIRVVVSIIDKGSAGAWMWLAKELSDGPVREGATDYSSAEVIQEPEHVL